ncbi:hypothetical protein CSHISOI_09641 [Colletotrichum shisoi]|uniref:Uncharacterized protein n=1 Tax=Colletotrichum shisoi TaxID=2078593 RepID=A0A5Q4BG66_9PEZI|nr:hypothetical protein CSHISOI_09641 [Colletotrichum shisoi]
MVFWKKSICLDAGCNKNGGEVACADADVNADDDYRASNWQDAQCCLSDGVLGELNCGIVLRRERKNPIPSIPCLFGGRRISSSLRGWDENKATGQLDSV